MNSEDISRSLFKTSMIGIARVGLSFPVYLALTPLIYGSLGEELFAIWSFNTIVIGLLNLSDFGFKNGLVHFVAKSQSDSEVRDHYVNTQSVFLSIALMLNLALVVVPSAIYSQILNVPAHYAAELKFVLVLTGLGFGLRFLATPYQALLEGRQRVYQSQTIFIVWLIVNAGLSFLAVLLAPSVYSLTLATFVANVVVFILFRRYANREFAWTKDGPSLSWHKHRLKELFSYSGGIQIATLFIVLREPLLKVLVANCFGLATVASFEIAYRLTTQIISMVITPLLGVFAASSKLQDDHKAVREVLLPYFRFPLIVLLPCMAGLVFVGEDLLAWWLGNNDEEIYDLLIWLFVGFTCYYATESIYKAIEGSGFSWYSAKIQCLVFGLTMLAFVGLHAGNYSAAQTVGGSLLVGYTAFSVINFMKFTRTFSGVGFVDFRFLFVITGSILALILLSQLTNPTWYMLAVFCAVYFCLVLQLRVLPLDTITASIRAKSRKR